MDDTTLTAEECGRLRVLSCAGDAARELSDHAIAILWERFSAIQQATRITVDKESARRFADWMESGRDEDAWA